jgi:hypothetical protein
VSYFGFLQSLHCTNFFSINILKNNNTCFTFNILKVKLKNTLPAGGLVVKTLSQTRWSARADSTMSVFAHYKEIISALSEIYGDNNQTVHARAEAEGLANKMRLLLL